MKTTIVLKQLKGKLIKMGLDENKIYHKTKLLLKLYRDVLWVTENRIEDVGNHNFYKKDLAVTLRYLSDFAPDIERERFESTVTSIFENKYLIEIIDQSMLKLKNYPRNGRLFFEILSKQYLSEYPYTEKEILETLNLERSTFYNRKREAIYLLSIILWGFIIPQWEVTELYVVENK